MTSVENQDTNIESIPIDQLTTPVKPDMVRFNHNKILTNSIGSPNARNRKYRMAGLFLMNL